MTRTYSFKLPDIGEGIAEAEIVTWHVSPGDTVDEDAALADVMTDKATVEINSPVSGTVKQIAGQPGELIAIGSVLVVFEVDGADETGPEAIAEREAEEAISAAPAPPATVIAPETHPVPSGDNTEKQVVTPLLPEVQASPAVRKRARDLKIDLADVKPKEPGRIRHSDLDAFLTYNAAGGYRSARSPLPDEQVRIVGLRRRIAENMAASKRHIPHFTYVEEINVTRLEELRADLNATRGTKPRLTLLPLLIVSICKAMPDFPMLNALYDDEAGIVTRFGAVHLGLATQTDAGLIVPVIRNAESRNIWQLATEILRLAEAARNASIRAEEMTGSTLTITSLGPLAGIAATPVINRPEAAILCPNKIVERPIFQDGSVVPAKLMNFSISCDHRIVDGWDAASFAQSIKRLLETPSLMFAG
ncbi:MAG: dihydrolipoamide acetyltransferase family protein [Sphingomonadaceae bacterium]